MVLAASSGDADLFLKGVSKDVSKVVSPLKIILT
jgi:hypothetical protein